MSGKDKCCGVKKKNKSKIEITEEGEGERLILDRKARKGLSDKEYLSGGCDKT